MIKQGKKYNFRSPADNSYKRLKEILILISVS